MGGRVTTIADRLTPEQRQRLAELATTKPTRDPPPRPPVSPVVFIAPEERNEP
jgi:hypothetical protein